jgi:hypothetical protein
MQSLGDQDRLYTTAARRNPHSGPISLVPQCFICDKLGIKTNAILDAIVTKTKRSEIRPGLLVLFNSHIFIHYLRITKIHPPFKIQQ